MMLNMCFVSLILMASMYVWDKHAIIYLLIQILSFTNCQGLLEREQSRALPIQMDMGAEVTITICTGLKRYIACRDGANIAVTYAFWGRVSDKICPSDDGDPVTDCEASEDTLGLVKAECEAKNECQLEAKHSKLQKNGTHHCPGVNKYLIVNFTCVPESKGVTLCDSAEATLSCPSNWSMELADVFWGRRQNSRYCGSENSMECDSSDHASKVLKSKCNEKKKCTIKADSQDLDNAKPPCPGMLKYLMVNYICKPASSKFEESDEEDNKILSDTSSKELMGLLEKHLNEIKTPEPQPISAGAKDMTKNFKPLPQVEEKKIDQKQYYSAKPKVAAQKTHTRANVGKSQTPSFVATEDDDLANSLLNTPTFSRAAKKQEVTVPVSHRKDEVIENSEEKESGAKSEDSYEVAEPNTVRSILARAKEVLKTLDGDNPSTSPVVNEADVGDDFLNKRGGIARQEKLVNDTTTAVKQVAKLAQSLVDNAEKNSNKTEKKKIGTSTKLKEAGQAAVQKPKPGTKKLGYRAGTGTAGIGNTP